MMEDRILNFRNKNLILPPFFNELNEKKLILSAGDGISSYKGSPLGICNMVLTFFVAYTKII